MKKVDKAPSWNDFVESHGGAEESTRSIAITSALDKARDLFGSLVWQRADIDESAIVELGQEAADLFESQVGVDIRDELLLVDGRGMYFPSSEESDEVLFFDGTRGAAGEYAGLSVQFELPQYNQVVYEKPPYSTLVMAQLCLDLSEVRVVSDSNILLEVGEDSDIIIPLAHQDLRVSVFSEQNQRA